MWKKLKPYLISCAIPLAVGGLSALLTAGGTKLYDRIEMPPLSPPALIFPIVWTLLYLLMGISAAGVFLSPDSRDAGAGLTVYAISLIFNFFWTLCTGVSYRGQHICKFPIFSGSPSPDI